MMRVRRLHSVAVWSATRTSSVSTLWSWRWCDRRGVATTWPHATGAITSELQVSATLLIQPGGQVAAATAGPRSRFTRNHRSVPNGNGQARQLTSRQQQQQVETLSATSRVQKADDVPAATCVSTPPTHRSTEAARKLMQVHGTLSKNYVTLQRSLKVCQSFCNLVADALLSSGLLYDLCMQSTSSDERHHAVADDKSKSSCAASRNGASPIERREMLVSVTLQTDVVRSSAQPATGAAPRGTLVLPISAVQNYLNTPVVLPSVPVAALHPSCTDTTDMVARRWTAALQQCVQCAGGRSSRNEYFTCVSTTEVRLLHDVFGLHETPDATTVRSMLHLLLSVEQFKWVKDDLLLLGPPTTSMWPAAATSVRSSLLRAKTVMQRPCEQTSGEDGNDTSLVSGAASPTDSASTGALLELSCKLRMTILHKIPRVNRVTMHDQGRNSEVTGGPKNAQLHVLDVLFYILFRYVLTYWPLLESADRGAFFHLTTLPWLTEDIGPDMALWYTYAELAAMRTGPVAWDAHVRFIRHMRTLCWPIISDTQSSIVQRLLQTVTGDAASAEVTLPPLRQVTAVLHGSSRKQRHTYELLYLYVDALRRVRCTSGGTLPALPPTAARDTAPIEPNTLLAPAPSRGCEMFVLYILDIDRFLTTRHYESCWMNGNMWPLLRRVIPPSQKPPATATALVAETRTSDETGDNATPPTADASSPFRDDRMMNSHMFYTLSRNTFIALADPLTQAWRRTPVARSRTLWDGLLRCVEAFCGEAITSPDITFSVAQFSNDGGKGSGEGQKNVRINPRSLLRAALRAWTALLPFCNTLRERKAFVELLEEQLLVALDLLHTRIAEHATRSVEDTVKRTAAENATSSGPTKEVVQWCGELLRLGCLAGLLLFSSDSNGPATAAIASSQQCSFTATQQRFATQLQHQLTQCVDAMLKASSQRGGGEVREYADATVNELLRSWACVATVTRKLQMMESNKHLNSEGASLLAYVRLLGSYVFTPALHARVRVVARAVSSSTEPGVSFDNSVFHAWQEQLRDAATSGKPLLKPATTLFAELSDVSARRLRCTGPARLFTLPELSVLLAVLTEAQLRRGVPGLVRAAPSSSLFTLIAHSITANASGGTSGQHPAASTEIATPAQPGACDGAPTDVSAKLAAIESLIAESVQAHRSGLSLTALLNAVALDLVSLFDVAAFVHARTVGKHDSVAMQDSTTSDGMSKTEKEVEEARGGCMVWLRGWQDALRTTPLVRNTALFLLYRERDFLHIDDAVRAAEVWATSAKDHSVDDTLRCTASLLQWLLRSLVEAELASALRKCKSATTTISEPNAGAVRGSDGSTSTTAGASSPTTLMHFTLCHARVYCLAQYILLHYGPASNHHHGDDTDELTVWYDGMQRVSSGDVDAVHVTSDEEDGGVTSFQWRLRGPAGLQTLYTLFLNALRTAMPCADRGNSDEWFLWLATTTLIAQAHWQSQLTRADDTTGGFHDNAAPQSTYCTLVLPAEQHTTPLCAPAPTPDVLTCLPSDDARGGTGYRETCSDNRSSACSAWWGAGSQVCDATTFPCLQAWATHLFSRLVPHVQSALYNRLTNHWSRIAVNVLAAVHAYTQAGIDTSRCGVACQNIVHLFLAERERQQMWRGVTMCCVAADVPGLQYQFPLLLRRHYRPRCGLSTTDAERLLHAISTHVALSNAQTLMSSSSGATVATSTTGAAMRPLTGGANATPSRDRRRRSGAEVDVTLAVADDSEGNGNSSISVSDGEEEAAASVAPSPLRSPLLVSGSHSFSLRRSWADLTRFLLHHSAPPVQTASALVAALQCGALLQCTDTAIYEELLAFVLFGDHVACLTVSQWAVVLRAVGSGDSRGTDSRRELAAALRAPVMQCLERCTQYPLQDVTQSTSSSPAIHGAAFCDLLEALPAVFVEDDLFWRVVGAAVRAWSSAASTHMTVDEAQMWQLQWSASYAWALRSAGHVALVQT